MKDGHFETRREQIETEDLRDLMAAQHRSQRAFRNAAKKALQGAAMCAGAGERDRTLELIRATNMLSDEQKRHLESLICLEAVLKVLGW